jgi:hypothetical protein
MENKGLKRLLFNVNKSEMDLWFISFFVGLDTRVEPKYPSSIFYDKDNETLFELCGQGYLFVHNFKIWEVFETKYGLNDTEIQNYIRNVVEHQNIISVIPPYYTRLEGDTVITPFRLDSLPSIGWKTPLN